MAKKYISVFNNGTQDLYVKDAEARQSISDIESAITGGMHYIGTSTTVIADGDSTGPWVIDGVTFIASGTPTSGQKLLSGGDVAIYGELEFVWSATAGKWKEFGSTGSLKSLAFKNQASGNFTPSGSNSPSAVSFEGGTNGDFVVGYNNDKVDPSFQEGAFSPGSLPTMTYDESSEKLTFAPGALPTKAADTFSAGSAATLATAKAVTNIGTGTAAAQTFSGSEGSVTVS